MGRAGNTLQEREPQERIVVRVASHGLAVEKVPRSRTPAWVNGKADSDEAQRVTSSISENTLKGT